MLEVPLTIGIIGAALMPVLAAIGAAAALATRCTIVVEREYEPSPSVNGTPSAIEEKPVDMTPARVTSQPHTPFARRATGPQGR